MRHVYRNPLESPIEATFIFPMSVLISKLKFTIGEKTIEAKIVEKQKAKQQYDDAVAGGKAAVVVRKTKSNEV